MMIKRIGIGFFAILLAGCEQYGNAEAPENRDECILQFVTVAQTNASAAEASKACERMFFEPADFAGISQYDEHSMIAASDKRYPLFVIRSGHQVIQQSPEHVLVGWSYDVVNTSARTYSATVDYALKDVFGHTIGSSTSTERVTGGSIQTLYGEISLSHQDAARLPMVPERSQGLYTHSNWMISLDPDWAIEPQQGTTTSERAIKILSENPPTWLMFRPANDPIKLSKKWAPLFEILEPEEASVEPESSPTGAH